MFSKKKKTLKKVEVVLRNQQAEYGDIASIEDLIALIYRELK